MHEAYYTQNSFAWVILLGITTGSALAAENSYTFTNSSCVEIKISLWFTNALKGSARTHEREQVTGVSGVLPSALPMPDAEVILQPQETHTITDHDVAIQHGECLAYLVAEYRIIPSVMPSMAASTGIPADLYLIGKRSWGQKLPGLCGTNSIEMNYDPATYLQFTIKINGVEDYFQAVS